MAADYNKILEDSIAKKREEQEALRAEQLAEQQRKREEHTARVAPLNSVLEPAFEEFNQQMAGKVTIEQRSDLPHDPTSQHTYSRNFQLKMKTVNTNIRSSEMFGFRIYEKGNIEGVVYRATGSGPLRASRTFLAAPSEFNATHVERMLGGALEDLARKA